MIYENPHLSFVTDDEEHHPVAFLDFGPLTPRDTQTELRVKDPSVLLRQPRAHDVDGRPDPDGNRVELQVDNFATAEEGQAWMHSPAFDRNPIGVEYDPDELVKRFNAGVPVAELAVRD